MASSWGASPDDVVFVSSGTEAAQTAIRSELEPRLLAAQRPHCRTHWILGAGDHDAHQQMATWVQARGGSVSRAPLLPTGEMDLARLEALLRPETALVSLVWVNNETGVVTDVAAVARLCRARGVPLHLDAAQAWGKLPLDLPTCGAQWVSFSGHKIGALPGIGALWRGPGAAALEPLVLGKQERGSRGGTENLLGAISLGGAAASLDPVAWAERVSVSRDALEQRILVEIPGATVYGARAARRVANTSFLGFDGVEKAGLVAALDLTGYGVSSGSACQSGMTEPSHVLVAMGVGEGPARAAVRVSLDDSLELSEADAFVAALAKAVAQARG